MDKKNSGEFEETESITTRDDQNWNNHEEKK